MTVRCGRCGNGIRSFKHYMKCEQKNVLSIAFLKINRSIKTRFQGIKEYFSEIKETQIALSFYNHLRKLLILQEKSGRKNVKDFRVFNIQVHDVSDLEKLSEGVMVIKRNYIKNLRSQING